MGVESLSGGCNLSSKLSCGVEELKSSVDIVAKICEASMEEGRAYINININNLIPLIAGLGAQGIPQFYLNE